jgi:hypothetical protein
MLKIYKIYKWLITNMIIKRFVVKKGVYTEGSSKITNMNHHEFSNTENSG